MFRSHLCLLCLLLALAPALRAQDFGTELKSVYELSQTAKSEADYGMIIDRINTLGIERADDTNKAYGKRLLSWALNRRGELRWDRIENAQDETAQAALNDFELALQADPTRWRAKQNIAFAYAMHGDLAKGEQLLTEVLQAQPGHANAYFNRGEMRYELNQLDGALADYNKAIELSPGEADFYTSRGHAHFRGENYTAANSDYQAAIRMDPRSASRVIDYADSLQHIGKFTQAESQYRQALQVEPKNIRAQLNLAWLLSTSPVTQQRRPAEALKIVQSLGPVNAREKFRYLDTYAAAQAASGNYSEAVRLASSALAEADAQDRPPLISRIERYKSGRAYYQSRN